jgi:glycosyltransferase involved in cell wall biosynthesis
LKRLLDTLQSQYTNGLFAYSVAIVDNDSHQSAENAVRSFRETSELEVRYYVEPEQNIALARNMAARNAKGNLIAFIDDDELPPPDWLLRLFTSYTALEIDGVLGPVLPVYEGVPPVWVLKGRFYERPSHKTGTILDWEHTRTGNVLLKRSIFDNPDSRFRPEFGRGGEDRDFFRRVMQKGWRFAWCSEAPVFEAVSPERYKRSIMLKRALVRGANAPYDDDPFSHLKSLVAIPLYTLILPVLALMPHHLFMRYLIKDFDHIGRLLSLVGIDAVKEKYIVTGS